jgi:hypothetical protein
MHPFLRTLIVGFGRVGMKAGLAAADSVVADLQKAGEEVVRRSARTRQRIKKARPAEAAQEEEEEE